MLKATILQITQREKGIILATAQSADAKTRQIIAYTDLVGDITVGDTVILNTTATGLNLGTGGFDFVISVESENGQMPARDPDAHIIKLRYTPHQIAVKAEELHRELPEDLKGVPVVVCGLHSQMGAVVAAIKTINPNVRIAYIMTDAAALPLAFSRLVRQLKNAKLLDATITTGQAFGGDYEAVTVASGLLLASTMADIIVVSQGPGNAGTGTKYGFSGLEQAEICNTANVFDARIVGVLRMSEADLRERHQGVSHHSVTVFGEMTYWPVHLVVPEQYTDTLPDKINYRNVTHHIPEPEGWQETLTKHGIVLTSMGREIDADPLFFAAAAVAGSYAYTILTLNSPAFRKPHDFPT
jgi:hypothetical protein